MLSTVRMMAVTALALLAMGAQPAAAQLPPLPPIAPLPDPLGPPELSGTPESGNTLVCTNGGWLLVTPTKYERVWLRGATPIPGSTSETADAATPASYKLTEQDVGQLISCRVTAYNDTAASLPADSAPTAPVGLGAPRNVTPPTVSPSPTVQAGDTAVCNPGSWLNASGLTASYEWARDGVKVADGQQYVVAAGDAGSYLTCTERIATAAAQSAPVVVTGTAPPTPPLPVPLPVKPVSITPPVIDGAPQEGRTVTCVSGLWLNDPTSYSYKWQRDGADIAAATAADYAIAGADVGRALTCTIVASNDQGASSPATSLPTYPLAAGLPLPVNQSLPTIAGTARPGQALTCAPGTWIPADATYAYLWSSDGGPIAGASAAAYTVRDADVGSKLTCTVTASTDIGSSRATSASVTPTAAPAPAPPAGPVKPANTAAPALTGGTVVGQTLSCSQGTWTGHPTAIQVRWLRNGKLIAGAQQATYRLQAADAGQEVACAVIASNSAGFAAAASRKLRAKAAAVAAPDTRAPAVTKFRATPRRFVRGRGKTTFKWRVSEPAWVTIVVERKVAGRLAGGRCKPARPGARTKAGRRCTIWKRATTLIVPAKPGANSLPFAGMVGKRLLRAGAYRASLVAMDIATNKSAVRRAKLKLDTPPKKKRPRK